MRAKIWKWVSRVFLSLLLLLLLLTWKCRYTTYTGRWREFDDRKPRRKRDSWCNFVWSSFINLFFYIVDFIFSIPLQLVWLDLFGFMRSICQKANNLFHRSLGSKWPQMKTVYLSFFPFSCTLCLGCWSCRSNKKCRHGSTQHMNNPAVRSKTWSTLEEVMMTKRKDPVWRIAFATWIMQ